MKAPIAGEIKTAIKQWGKHIFTQIFTLDNGKSSDFLLMEACGKPVIFMALTKDCNIIAVRQFRYGANDFILEFPGGMPKGNQTPEDTLRAELLEETGYAPKKVIWLGDLWFEPAFMRVQYTAMLALDCYREDATKLDEFEVMETEEIPLETWLNMCRNGEVVDSKTLAITCLVQLYLANQGKEQ